VVVSTWPLELGGAGWVLVLSICCLARKVERFGGRNPSGKPPVLVIVPEISRQGNV
jgi:hypothetical protein